MLKKLLTQKKYFKHLHKYQKGITGLETAIILIAFVVVAAVFAYTVLSAGLFSTQKSQEAVYSGLKETQSTLEIKGSVTTGGEAQIDRADALGTWTAGAHGAVAYSAGTGVEGAGCIDMTALQASAVANDTIAYATVVQRALVAGDIISFWAKVDTELIGDVTFAIATSNDLHATPTETKAIDGADTNWHKYTMTLTAGTGDTDADNYGVYISAGPALTGDAHVLIDDIQIDHPALSTVTDVMNTFANSVGFTVSLAVGGEPIDFTPTVDSDGDGILSDESTKLHRVVISYNDGTQTVPDLAWSISKIGKTDTDNLLDVNEKFQVNVDLNYINQHASSAANKVCSSHKFTLEVKPPAGATLTIERTMPDRIHEVDNLN